MPAALGCRMWVIVGEEPVRLDCRTMAAPFRWHPCGRAGLWMFSNLPNGIEAQVEPRHHCLDHEVRGHAECRALPSTIELSASLPPAYCQRPYHLDGCRRARVPFLLDPVWSGHSLISKY